MREYRLRVPIDAHLRDAAAPLAEDELCLCYEGDIELAMAQLITTATVYGDRRLTFDVSYVVPTDVLVTSREAQEAIANATQRV